MKRGILLGALLLGGLLVGLVYAGGNSASARSCWTPWDHNTDVREWSDNEWVWAGIHGQVLVCDGRFQQVLTDTVHGVYTAKGMKQWYGGVVKRSQRSYAYVRYIRYNGDQGTAFADIPHLFG
ncbi:hypothetical protein A3L12_04195 [Thermococcus sp. P6]|uniref:hypothetical protein n=1 Tax=Thermococcus sp. P6 TaxID=122420 RepID=UPI000B59DE1A|nr:hypothetical protein [Thermococcus sp. P6]ASJ10553.1 hypothetical protein A3L12_04195 [Thermococcus sp. P6]